MTSILEDFGLSPQLELGVLQAVWGSDVSDPDLLVSPTTCLQKWLPLLPQSVSQQITLALNQERPFMPPDVTPEMMALPNETVPSMNHIEIIYRCIDFAMKAGDYNMAAALVYVVDRACYRYGKSAALLHVVEAISQASPDTPMAPQVILRQARVKKDSGDLHTAMRVLDDVITRERKWDYKTEEQYENTKAVCVQIKGQILHNLGLWKEAIPPLVESVQSFNIVNDNKGTSSSLALLSRCLKKLEERDYQDLQRQFLGVFRTGHPFYEAYLKGVDAVHLIENLGATVYLAHNQLVADESLLMFTIQHTHMTERQKLDQYQVIVDEMKRSLATHRSVHSMLSLEVYLAFVRALFVISLTLHFSPIPQDSNLSRFLEKLSIELYACMCQQTNFSGEQTSTSLRQTPLSVRSMNAALALLGLSRLEGSDEVENKEGEKKWSEVKHPGLSVAQKGVGSSSPKESPTDSIDGCQIEESASASGGSEVNQPQRNLSTAVKAGTFPAVTSSKFEQGGRLMSDQRVKQKFVGLTMSTDDLQSATCPILGTAINLNNSKDDVDAPQPQVDLEALCVSADTIGSVPASSPLQPSSATAPALFFGTAGSSSSGTRPPKDVRDSGSDSTTVDRSATTKSTSSATTESSDSPVDHSSTGRDGSHRSEISSVNQSASSKSSSSGNSGSSKSSSSGNSENQSASSKSSSSGNSENQSASSKSSSSASSENQSASTKSSGSSDTPQSCGVNQPASTTSSPSSVSTESAGSSATPPTGLPDSQSSRDTPPSYSSGDLGSKSCPDRDKSTTVDQLADTEPSSTCDSTSSSDLSPLVDVSSSCDLMAGLHLGSSVETSDSSEFLAHFSPADNQHVHRAILMLYNPVTGLWSAQTTLAYQGPLLSTSGKHRDAYHVSFLHQDEPLGRYVSKRYKGGQKTPEVYMQDVVCQMLAGYYVTRFNQALQHCPLDILQVQFLSAAHLQLLDRDGCVNDWVNVEPFLHGSFLKLTNNLHFVSRQEKDERGVEVATAISHFTFAETRGALMMVDLQGWTPADGRGMVYLTDPVFHTRDLRKFSSGDLHLRGMQAFWTKQHPRCNQICQYLGLDKIRPDA